MKKRVIILIMILFLMTSCSQRLSEDASSSKELQEAQKNIDRKEQEIEGLRKQVDQLNTKLDAFKPKETKKKPNLAYWSIDDIIKGLATKKIKFKDASWFQYRYAEEGYYYDLVGPIFPQDPFFKIAYSIRDRELNVNGIRIFDIDSSRSNNEEAYTRYVEEINKQSIIDPKLVCIEQTDCAEINLITCNAEGQTLYSWYVYPYMIFARNDNGETYEAFKEWYC